MMNRPNLLRYIKNNCVFVWHSLELMNGILNKIFLSSKFGSIVSSIESTSIDNEIEFKKLGAYDSEKLFAFLNAIDLEEFRYFKPFPITIKSIKQVLTWNNFIVFEATQHEQMVGLFFLRVGFNKKAFLGFFVSKTMRGLGLGRSMIAALSEACRANGMSLFSNVSRDNIASWKAHIYNGFSIIDQLEDNYCLLALDVEGKNGK